MGERETLNSIKFNYRTKSVKRVHFERREITLITGTVFVNKERSERIKVCTIRLVDFT